MSSVNTNLVTSASCYSYVAHASLRTPGGHLLIIEPNGDTRIVVCDKAVAKTCGTCAHIHIEV
jgi:hypothetical protein